MNTYDFKTSEPKWKKYWEDSGLHKVDLSKDPHLYCLVMFCYPSADKLHMGHWFNDAPTDSWARFKRMQGYSVFQPMGFDAFGLPAENYAIKTGVHPLDSTEENIKTIRNQIQAIGGMYDWGYEVITCRPAYYKWTQYLFLQLYKKGLAYKKKAPVNFCPSCNTVLANEQVVGGKCERCDSEVTKKNLSQWFFKITAYAEELLADLPKLDWPEKTKAMQENWIGKSIGTEISFPLENGSKLDVFTTRIDTIFGATFMVIAPEHELVSSLTTKDTKKIVDEYIEQTKKITEIERTSTVREKTGVFTGSYAINSFTKKRIPIWIADYVLASYGHGAIMAVPAHDERDYAFAKKYNLEIVDVIAGTKEAQEKIYSKYGTLINSGEYTGRKSEEAITKLNAALEKEKLGCAKINYKLRDWLISRQRYWGTPIPIIYCTSCGEVPVPEQDLPVVLPYKVKFEPTGESPLAKCPEFMNTPCPRCGKKAERDPDTMDTFVCSSWYFLRYLTPKDSAKPFNNDLVKKYLPVNQYVGGAEHAVMHLLYARFFVKALRDCGLLSIDEPFQKLIHQGVILGPDGNRMSKSRGNVINPERYLELYGSDVLRLYLEFAFAYIDGGPWDDKGIEAMSRFIQRVYRIIDSHQWVFNEGSMMPNSSAHTKLEYTLHNAIKNVTIDLDRFSFNTALARIMEVVNELYTYANTVKKEEYHISFIRETLETLIKLIAPFAPCFAEEVWQLIGNKHSVFLEKWPTYDESILQGSKISLPIQINGKLRKVLEVDRETPEEKLFEFVLADEQIRKYTDGKKIVKKIYVKEKLINLVVA